MGRKRILTDEVLDQCLQEREAGVPVGELAERHGVTASTMKTQLSRHRNKSTPKPAVDKSTPLTGGEEERAVEQELRARRAVQDLAAIRWEDLDSYAVGHLRKVRDRAQRLIDQWERG